jgi:uncharacterized protein (DUF2384 family)
MSAPRAPTSNEHAMRSAYRKRKKHLFADKRLFCFLCGPQAAAAQARRLPQACTQRRRSTGRRRL